MASCEVLVRRYFHVWPPFSTVVRDDDDVVDLEGSSRIDETHAILVAHKLVEPRPPGRTEGFVVGAFLRPGLSALWRSARPLLQRKPKTVR